MQNSTAKTRRKSIQILPLLLLACNMPVHADNLAATYRAAETSDAQIRAAYALYQAQREAVPQSRSALLPSIEGEVSQSKSTRDITQNPDPLSIEKTETESDGWSVTLRQTIYNHANYAALRQARANVSKAEADYNTERQNLIIRVAQAYFNVLAAIDTLDFAEAEKKSVSQQLDQTKQRFEVGLIAITDVKESQASYDLAVAQEIQASNTLATRREELRAITNQYPEVLKPLDENMPLISPEPADIEQWVNTALQQNLTLQAAKHALEAADKEVSRVRSGHYPSLDFIAQKRGDINETPNVLNSLREQEDTTFTLQLSIPIYSGGGISSRVTQAVYNEDATRENLESQRRSVIQQTRNNYNSVIADISRVKALKQALASTQAAYEATNAGFEVGTRNSAEVLLSLRDTYRARRDYSQARYDYILNSLRLKQASGTLSVQDIDAINKWLN